MEIYQVRFGRGERLDKYRPLHKTDPADRFCTKKVAERMLRIYKSAKVVKVRDIDIRHSDHVASAEMFYPANQFEAAAVRMVSLPQPPSGAGGYPQEIATILVNGEPRNVEYKLVQRRDPAPGWGCLGWQIVGR